MSDEKIGAKPEPETERPEHFPGGADAVDDSGKYGDTPGGPATRDLHPEGNPAVEDDEVPDEISELDEKQQEPDDDSGENPDQPTEPPA